jgi:hypothetical protein
VVGRGSLVARHRSFPSSPLVRSSERMSVSHTDIRSGERTDAVPGEG